jgi:cyclopropane fatty-acyl-phospholipid synthase-like methyltransferase
MSDNLSYWKNFWENQSTPLHRYNTEEWYRRYAQEINLILESLGYQGGSVLETGCGNGALFDHLKIDKQDYIGTDISESLTKIFQERHPDLKIICTDSESYQVERQFSLIFSNAVLQHFSPQQLDRYIDNSLKMLDSNGILLMANMLDRDAKSKFYDNGADYSQIASIVSQSKTAIKEKVLKQTVLGNWYRDRDFLKFRERGLEMHVFGSLFHPYRFSLAFKKTS